MNKLSAILLQQSVITLACPTMYKNLQEIQVGKTYFFRSRPSKSIRAPCLMSGNSLTLRQQFREILFTFVIFALSKVCGNKYFAKRFCLYILTTISIYLMTFFPFVFLISPMADFVTTHLHFG